MKFFLDTAIPSEIEEAYNTGLIEGVTTNPSLVAKAGIDYKEAIQNIFKIVDGPISLEVLSTKMEEIIQEAVKLSELNKNVVVKIPMGVEGLKAVGELKNKGIKTNVTLIFSSAQALLAAKAGADYVSPFVGRLSDTGGDSLEMLEQIRIIFDNYSYKTDILVASIRTLEQVIRVAEIGADVITLPPAIFWKLFKHPMTDLGLEKFSKDFEESGLTNLIDL